MYPPVRVIRQYENKSINNIQEWTNTLNFKYNALQSILIEKSDIKNTISIKNLSSEYSTIIGLVKQVKEGPERVIIDMEDMTAHVSVSMSKSAFNGKIMADDVVAVTGRLVGNIFEADTLVWPDIPLRTATKGYGKIALLANCQIDDKIAQSIQTADYVLAHNCTGWEPVAAKGGAQWVVTDANASGDPNMVSTKMPCLLEVDGLVVLVYFGPEQAADILRRRYIVVNGSDFLIDTVPDLVFTSTNDAYNYKGITIVGKGTVDAATCDVKPFD